MGLVNDLTGDVGDAVGMDFTGPIEDADTGIEAYGRLASGTWSYGESVISGVTGSSEEEVRNDHVATGGLRDVIDIAVEYDGTWGGETDSADLLGPAAWGTEGSVVDVLVDEDGEDHGAQETTTKALVVAAVVAAALVVLAPVINLVAAMLGGAES